MMPTPKLRQACLWPGQVFTLAVSWLFAANSARAETAMEMGGEPKSYVLPYLMVVLVVALGLLLVLRSAGRVSDVTQKQEDD